MNLCGVIPTSFAHEESLVDRTQHFVGHPKLLNPYSGNSKVTRQSIENLVV
jgi:hypothetical protein